MTEIEKFLLMNQATIMAAMAAAFRDQESAETLMAAAQATQTLVAAAEACAPVVEPT